MSKVDEAHYIAMKEIINGLKEQFNLDVSNDPEYTHIILSKTQKAFLELYSEKHNSSQSKIFRSFVTALMRRNPDIVKKAIEELEKEKEK